MFSSIIRCVSSKSSSGTRFLTERPLTPMFAEALGKKTASFNEVLDLLNKHILEQNLRVKDGIFVDEKLSSLIDTKSTKKDVITESVLKNRIWAMFRDANPQAMQAYMYKKSKQSLMKEKMATHKVVPPSPKQTVFNYGTLVTNPDLELTVPPELKRLYRPGAYHSSTYPKLIAKVWAAIRAANPELFPGENVKPARGGKFKTGG